VTNEKLVNEEESTLSIQENIEMEEIKQEILNHEDLDDVLLEKDNPASSKFSISSLNLYFLQFKALLFKNMEIHKRRKIFLFCQFMFPIFILLCGYLLVFITKLETAYFINNPDSGEIDPRYTSVPFNFYKNINPYQEAYAIGYSGIPYLWGL
jgi:hypothetical protein